MVPGPVHPVRRDPHRAAGFTLVELMMVLLLFTVVVGALAVIILNSARSKQGTTGHMESVQSARAALDMMARDIRCAGYGADRDFNPQQPAIAYVDSQEIIICADEQPYPDGSAGPAAPLAYNPAALPRPKSIDGNAWTPPTRYRTGAELIRYTMDVNNDGVVDQNDVLAAGGSDAALTANPNDFVLVRQVYGDSTGNVVNNNGGQQERVALIRKPGAGVPALFQVYLQNSATPWDWSNGPVPEAQLQNISRVTVQVTAAASKPDQHGNYPQTTLRSEVNSMRSVPEFGLNLYTVDGYVFQDKSTPPNGVMDGGDVGLPGVTVRLGSQYTAYTNSAGYFQFRVPIGSYTLRHTPPAGFGVWTHPDSFLVTVVSGSPTISHSFADTARAGGYVTTLVFNDVNANGIQDVGDLPLPNIKVTMSSGSQVNFTDVTGKVRQFAQVGGYSVNVTVPDSMAATTPNPVSGSLAFTGDSASFKVGLVRSINGKVQGMVYKDLNKNGVVDAGEAGLPNVWVGATTDNGLSISGYAYTDNNGAYSISVPANDPPHTMPYSVYVVPPAGYFPTGSTSIAGIYVQANQTLTGYNFGMASFQVISLAASRVLSLAAADLIEKDWPGNQTNKAHADQDLILGADAGGTDNISVWFNQWNSSPLFTTTPTATSTSGYTRLAPNSVMAMAIDTLDRNAPVNRPDLVTGTKYTAGGNFFVWYTQNTSGNEGYFSNTYSAGQNYKTLDNGDVQAVKTLDCLGGQGPEIIVGTKSATALQGSIEIWQNNDAVTPSFTRAETYTLIAPGVLIGEVNAIRLQDLDNDGLKDMIVATKTGTYSGQLLFYKNMGKASLAPHFQLKYTMTFGGNSITSIAVTDVDGDGLLDVIAGTQSGSSTGNLVYCRNKNAVGVWSFTVQKVVAAPGIVLSLNAADFGGDPTINDLAMGWRSSDTGYGGGVLIYFLDVRGLPSSGVDPSGGSLANMVPALASANFNYGLNSGIAPTPYLTDLAAGVKTSATTGALVVFIR